MKNSKLKSMIILWYFNQRDFAKVLGIQESIVSNVIKGRYNLTIDEKILWAGKLKCAVEDVFGAAVYETI